MKKRIKTLLGLALSVILVFSVVSVAFAEAKPHYTTEIPTVYLAGQGTNLWNVPGYDRSESFFPLEIPDGYIGDAGKSLIAPLFKGIATDDWEE